MATALRVAEMEVLEVGYPIEGSAQFDVRYYVEIHGGEVVKRELLDSGLVERVELWDAPGYHRKARLYVRGEVSSLMKTAEMARVLGDLPNFTDAVPETVVTKTTIVSIDPK